MQMMPCQMVEERCVIPASDSDDRRNRALIHARDLIAAWTDYSTNKSTFKMAEVETAAEALFVHLLTAFQGEITPEQGRELMTKNRDYLAPEVLADTPDAFVPIALIRTVLFKHRVMFNPASTRHWAVFVERYGRHLRAA